MFCCFRRRKQESCKTPVEVGSALTSNPQSSDQKDSQQHPVVPDTLLLPTSAPKQKGKKKSWWCRLWRKKDKYETVDTVTESAGGEDPVPQALPTPDCTTVSPAPELLQVKNEDDNTSSSSKESEGGDEVCAASPAPDTTEVGPEEVSIDEDLSKVFTEQRVLQVFPTLDTSVITEHGPEDEDMPESRDQSSPAPEERVCTEDGLQLQSEDEDRSTSASMERYDTHNISSSSAFVFPSTRVQTEDGPLLVAPTEVEGEDRVDAASPAPDATELLPVQEEVLSMMDSAIIYYLETEESDDQEEEVSVASSTESESSDEEDTELPPPTTEHRGRMEFWGNKQLLNHQQERQMDLRTPGLGGYQKSRPALLSKQELYRLGFPNLAQTCYMNSTLQALLSLKPFMEGLHSQSEVWSSVDEANVITWFMEVEVCHLINSRRQKENVLSRFKNIIAEFNDEFKDDRQKDAQEFMSCVLNSMNSLSDFLMDAALSRGLVYTCPVSTHMSFQMLSTRTCMGCKVQSYSVQDHMDLSLDLVPKSSVSQLLENCLKESQLSFCCECGSNVSSIQPSFLTLPNVLILHLKRFTYSRCKLRKINYPVQITPEISVSSSDDTVTHRYSLVSIISHLGDQASSGHYLCDSVHRDETSSNTTECWLTYDDQRVSQTSRASVCRLRQPSAYLLFYEKQL